jgi:hypothetical protein
MMMVMLHLKNASKASNILHFFEQINRRQGEFATTLWRASKHTGVCVTLSRSNSLQT